jgi:P pilus assembly chaperone PapD
MNIDNKSSKKLTTLFNIDNSALSLLLFMTLMASSFSSQAVSLTSYRIYLDDNNRTESFIVFAKGNSPEKCSLKLKHFNFDDKGAMTLHKDKKTPDNSSKPWIRFSPKNFTVQPRKPQTIRFTMRRKPNTEANEYRSYLAVSCKDTKTATVETVPGRPSVTVQPNLVQNVPIIVRTGALQATAQFEDMSIENGKVTANLTRHGERSLYGRLSLVNNKTDEELRFVTGISIYPETTTYQFSFPINKSEMPAIDDLAIKFVENENYGGSLTIVKNLK